jgi:2'-5' RNA ligase
MADRFLFLELRDPRLNRVLTNLRSIFSGKKHLTNIHITLKGPQKTFDLDKNIKEYKRENAIIQIGGAGRFSNGAFHVVYLNVKCGDLRKYNLWRKPNYKESYNPHITLYEGTDRLLADAVYEFLTLENMEYECAEYDFTVHTRNQYGLFLGAFTEKGQAQGDLLDQEEALFKRARGAFERARISNKQIMRTW